VRTRLQARREQLWLSQADLAKGAGVAVRTVHSLEHGTACRRETVRCLLVALGIPWGEREDYFRPVSRTGRRRHVLVFEPTCLSTREDK
jgi:transcriptional regulator with XRE-family HTH domain